MLVITVDFYGIFYINGVTYIVLITEALSH